ncbi:hypothetical protein TBR22_A43360 [Luteitalea sp. TBR-22]|uniref:hypothetical protein n=1 Tax=Luteitalea sp. TBR-22 TaxID=2802971 RepID=UPI001AF50B48|nr:hypothetical protein [Luteitalea sp. TBR-22]BCS35110.1 hypothetical protein TBR22_A43360 [Luteitalea sp. TBR-22]
MAKRFIVGLHPGQDLAAVTRAVTAHGATWVGEPRAALPDVLVVAIPDDHDDEVFTAAVKRLDGVRYVEADALGWTS